MHKNFLCVFIILLSLVLISCNVSLTTPKVKTEHIKLQRTFKELKEPKENILLKSCGYGQTLKGAKINALKGLSQQIVAKVETEEVLEKSYKNGKISKSYQAKSQIESEILLKGVLFSKFIKDKSNYKICVYFTKKSLEETIEFLKDSLSIDFTKLNREELKKLLHKAYYLLALAYLSSDKKEIESFARKKIEKINTYLNFGMLTINTIPDNAEILINKKCYRPFTPILLPPEREYLVSVKAPGYKPETFTVFLSRGDRITKTVELQKIVKTEVKVYVYSNNSFLLEETKAILTKSGLKISSSPVSPNAIFVEFQDTQTEIEGYTRHAIKITVEAYRGNKLVLALSGKMKPFYTTSETEKIILQKNSKKLLEVVLKKLINQINFSKFKGSKNFDYRNIYHYTKTIRGGNNK